MVRRFALLIVALLAIFGLELSGVSAQAAPAETCTALARRLGLCTSASTDGSAVEVAGTIERVVPGWKPSRGTPAAGGQAISAEEVERLCLSSFDCNTRVAGAVADPVPANPQPGAPGAVVTAADVVRFLPATTGLHLEPDGWAVVGVPANVWIEIAPATVAGELLGQPAQVRFTPISYRFDYGDGVVRASATPGASWADLGQQELTVTATSHVYAERAARQASVTVVYEAEYRFGDGAWTVVAGAVTGTTPQQRVLVVVERTALTRPG